MRALLTGGASCGKSALAEDLCLALGGNLVYLAAMRPFGEEGAARVRKHRAQRAGKGFETVECYEDFQLAVQDERTEGATVLLECLGNVVANEQFSDYDANAGEGPKPKSADELGSRISGMLDALSRRCAHLVVVGNEVGADGCEYPAETTCYQQVIASVSRAWAAQCDFVAESGAGVPAVVKLAVPDELGQTVLDVVGKANERETRC